MPGCRVQVARVQGVRVQGDRVQGVDTGAEPILVKKERDVVEVRVAQHGGQHRGQRHAQQRAYVNKQKINPPREISLQCRRHCTSLARARAHAPLHDTQIHANVHHGQRHAKQRACVEPRPQRGAWRSWLLPPQTKSMNVTPLPCNTLQCRQYLSPMLSRAASDVVEVTNTRCNACLGVAVSALGLCARLRD